MPSFVAKNQPFLFSTTTKLAYEIDNDYYGGMHYVWVTLKYNDPSQPASSNPFRRAIRFLQDVVTEDYHSSIINEQIVGIIKGAVSQASNSVISAKEKDYIRKRVANAHWNEFMPMVYVIDTKKVYSRLIEVPSADKANNASMEYKLVDLREGEFEIIDLGEVFRSIGIDNKSRRLR